jgi:hypothetical protein
MAVIAGQIDSLIVRVPAQKMRGKDKGPPINPFFPHHA